MVRRARPLDLHVHEGPEAVSGAAWIRARDGALYLDPVFVFPEGFLCFGHGEEPELVVWLPEDADEHTPPPCDVVAVLQEQLGYGEAAFAQDPNGRTLPRCSAVVDSISYRGRAMRVIPGSEPPELAPAISYFFRLQRRIPVPPIFAEIGRYPGRCGGLVVDFPPDPYDARNLHPPELELGP